MRSLEPSGYKPKKSLGILSPKVDLDLSWTVVRSHENRVLRLGNPEPPPPLGASPN